MLFMGLGGTAASIPGSVLDLVAVSPFYGQAVTAPGHGDPNMLDSAVRLCAQFLGHERVLGEGETAGSATIKLDGVSQTPFSRGAGHYELWESLCSFNNEPVVFAFNVNNFKANFAGVYRAKDAAGNWVYPVNHPVGNQLGHLELGISADNTMPWCMEIRNETELATVVAEFEAWGIEASMIPACPPLLFAEALGQRIHKLAINSLGVDYETPLGNQDFSERWMRHGAMNAGMAAYYYLSGFTSGELSPSQPFDACGEN
jgi:hypothetical protein